MLAGEWKYTVGAALRGKPRKKVPHFFFHVEGHLRYVAYCDLKVQRLILGGKIVKMCTYRFKGPFQAGGPTGGQHMEFSRIHGTCMEPTLPSTYLHTPTEIMHPHRDYAPRQRLCTPTEIRYPHRTYALPQRLCTPTELRYPHRTYAPPQSLCTPTEFMHPPQSICNPKQIMGVGNHRLINIHDIHDKPPYRP